METKRNTIIFLHGGGVDHNWWQPQIESLEKDFAIFAPDLPGHGAKANEPFDMEQSLHDLEALFTDNDIDQALLVAASARHNIVLICFGHVDQSLFVG